MNAIVEKLYDVQTIQENNLEQIVEPKPISTVREESWRPTPQIEAETIDEVTIVAQSEILEEMPTKEPFPELEVVGQIHGTYIVAQMEDGFYLIDQHRSGTY